jgi:hypothetical protein
VALAVLVLSALAPTTFAASQDPRLKPLDSLTVFDAHDKKVGPVFSVTLALSGGPATAMVVFEVDQQPFVLRVEPQGCVGSASSVVYRSSDCSGSPFILTGPRAVQMVNLFPENAVDAPGHTLYLEDQTADRIPVSSFSGSQLDDGTCLPASFGAGATLIPVQSIVDLDTLFTPPFSVR